MHANKYHPSPEYSDERRARPVARGAFIGWMVFVCVLLAACGRVAAPRPTATPSSGPTAIEELPETNASKAIRVAEGGRVALRDGAEVQIPANGLTETSVVSLKVVSAPPTVPIPRNLIGRAYEFGLDGGSLTGIARFRLPLPSAITPDQYDIAVYRWNGQAWERVLARYAGNALEFGSNVPGGIFAILGQWRQADATLTLSLSRTADDRGNTPITATGQYRYSALPLLQNELVPARLTWKLDASGGMGQITGNPQLDRTLGEQQIWFKPDPTQSQGVIEFTQNFEVGPQTLDLQPGVTRNIYAILTVEDSPAPTRRMSKAVGYTLILPIRVIGEEAARPTLAVEPPANLYWHVRFNGQSMAQRPAISSTLPLGEFLALGGLGDYSITLEATIAGKMQKVSNEVVVTLALPTTPTPMPSRTPSPAPRAQITPSPRVATPTASSPMPATPTRRTPPGERTATPTSTATLVGEATITPTATRPTWASTFWADKYRLVEGECTMLHWNIQNVQSVFLNGVPVTGVENRQECPKQTTTYVLSITTNTGARQDLRFSIAVQSSSEPDIQFAADRYTIVKGQCAQLRWQTKDVNAVYLDDNGVPGTATKDVCPETSTVYRLRVERTGSPSTLKSLTIKVLPAEQIPLIFWAEQYAIERNKCTNLHWSVRDVSAVYLSKPDGEVGVAGDGVYTACPTTISQAYTLRAEASGDRKASKTIFINTFDPNAPGLSANEVIAQGIVNSVINVVDADPTTPNDQPGYQITLDGIMPLFKGPGDCCEAALTFKITQAQTDDAMANVVDWPVNPGQFVEFRGDCVGGTCILPPNKTFYFKLRSD
ncbi:MAG: hypothetical protein WHX53_09210 [Anaerolineae bacterium]